MKDSVKTSFTILFSCLLLSLPGFAQAKSIYVFDDSTGEISRYGEDFKLKQTLKVPGHLPLDARPETASHGLSVSASGRIIHHRQETNRTGGKGTMSLWYWDGAREFTTEVSMDISCVPPGDLLCHRRDGISPPVLDSSEPMFYWQKDITDAVRKHEHEELIYVKPRSEIYRIRFSAEQPARLVEERIAGFSFPECRCETGACPETCPAGRMVEPAEGVRDFMEVEHFVEGQLGPSSVDGSTYFIKKGGNWVETDENKNLEKPFLKEWPDGGCCGWVNESSDVLLVYGKMQRTVYDEWQRFGNRNYDVSFTTSGAQLSPDASLVAYTISLDAYGRDGVVDLRLRADGKENLEELARIKAALPGLPLVEIKRVENNLPIVDAIKNAEFIGWTDNKRLLLLKDGHIIIFDASTGKTAQTPLKAKSVRNVFVR